MKKLKPEKSLGYQVRRCHRRFDRLLNAYLAGHELKAGYWYYLRALWIKDGVTQKYLSDVTNVTETTTVSMINGMIEQGLVSRNRDEEDRRKMRITLTDVGRKLESELIHHAVNINRVAVSGIRAEDVQICIAVLAKMSENLQAELEGSTELSQKGASELVN